MAIPSCLYRITHSGSDYDVEDDTTRCEIQLRENAVDDATLILADANSDYYINKVTTGDRLQIKWDGTLRFDGYIDDVMPLHNSLGFGLHITARSVGRALLYMVCGEEYGSDSPHDDVDTISEIITDTGNGFIDLWVNKLLGTATDSGYSLGHDSGGTDYVATITGDIGYIYFPFEPVKDCLNDLLDIVQAIKGTNAGPHWIVHPTNYLCLATIANHEAGPANLWTTYWNSNQANSTLVQGTDFVETQFIKRPVEANYILYHGHFQKPVNELWTETGDNNSGGSSLWGSAGDPPITLTDDSSSGNYKVGSDSVKIHTSDEANVNNAYAYVPSSAQNWEVNKWGGQYNKPTINFHVKYSGNTTAVQIRLYSGTDYYVAELMTHMTSGAWRNFTLPIGPYWDEETDTMNPSWTESGSPTWNDIDYVQFNVPCQALGTGDVWVDNLFFDAYILRGARQSSAYSSSDPAKIKVVTDDIAKDDSGVEATVTGTIARLAYAHLLREKSSPLQGTVTIEGQPSILAGQLAHIHAASNGGSYGIDSDMRITTARHLLTETGFLTVLSLTSDVINSRPLPPKDLYNSLLAVSSIDHQTRQTGSLKTRTIDITQPIMEKSY